MGVLKDVVPTAKESRNCIVCGRLRDWLRRPQWGLRSMFYLGLLIAFVCSLSVCLSQYLASRRMRTIEWIDYNADTLRRAQSRGKPVLVVYHAPWSSRVRNWTLCPFDDPDVIALVNRLGLVAMDADWNWSDERSAIQRDLQNLQCETPVIAIYDSQRGNMVIPPLHEGDVERAARVGEMLRQFADRKENR